jgi:hypothetical protein
MGREKFYVDCYRGKFLNAFDNRYDLQNREEFRFVELTKEQYDGQQEDRLKRRAAFAKLVKKHVGETMHVLGNGPSAKGFVPDGNPVIGVNAAGLLHEVDYLVIMDRINDERDLNKFLRQHVKSRPKSMILTTPQVEIQHNICPDLAGWVPDGVFDHTSEPQPRFQVRNGLYSLQSSVHAALDLARHMGASEIRLWGVDYNDRSHFYSGSKEIPADTRDVPSSQWVKWERHLEGFSRLKKSCDEAGVRIFNMSPNSRLALFPKMQPAEPKPEAKKVESAGPNPNIHVFGTIGTPYEQEMTDCVARFREVGVELTPVPLENSANWMRNCCARSIWLDAMYPGEFGGTIGLIDADLYPRSNPLPHICPEGEWDVAMHWQPDHKNDFDKCQATIVLFRDTEKGRAMLREWARLCRDDQTPKRKLREQLYLFQAVKAVEPRIHDVGLRCNTRPEQVGYVDGMGGVIIEHRPASRKYLKVIGGER